MLVLIFCTVISAGAENLSVQRYPGFDYFHKWSKDTPWSVHVARVDRKRPEYRIETTLPQGKLLGLSPTTEQMKFLPAAFGKPIAAINGDFFSWRPGPYQGDPMGLQILQGEMVSGPAVTKSREQDNELGAFCFWIDTNGTPHARQLAPQLAVTLPNGKRLPFRLNMERAADGAAIFTHIIGSSTRTTNGVDFVLEASDDKWLPLRAGEVYNGRIREKRGPNAPVSTNFLVLSLGPEFEMESSNLKEGDIVQISTATQPSLKGVQVAIGGGPMLVREGRVMNIKDPARHPRAGFGFNEDYYFFVVADGRRANITDGMTFQELGREMKWWGCTDAINLDGGGSAMLWVDGAIVSQPSENRERPCANALVLLRKEK